MNTNSENSTPVLSPEAVLFLSHVHDRHLAVFNDEGLPAEYAGAFENELNQLQTLAGAVDVSWLGLTLHQDCPEDVASCLAVPSQWPDGFFRHTVPEGNWIELGSSVGASESPAEGSQPLPACMLQLLGPEWIEVLDNLWIEPPEREALIHQSEAIASTTNPAQALASHLVGIPLVYVPNRVIPAMRNPVDLQTPPPGCGLLVSHDHAEVLWETLMSAGLSMGLNPVGVHARKAYYEALSGEVLS